MKILVVDDERLLVKGIKFNLENEGYTVDACYDGESAVNMARTGFRPVRRSAASRPCPSSCSPPAARGLTCSWALSPGRTIM